MEFAEQEAIKDAYRNLAGAAGVNFDEKDVEVSCDFPSRATDKLPLHVTCRNPYVTLTRCNPAAVEFLIEQTKKTTDK